MFNSEGLWKSGEYLVKALWMFERLIQNSKKLIYRELATNFSSCVKTFIIYDLTIYNLQFIYDCIDLRISVGL